MKSSQFIAYNYLLCSVRKNDGTMGGIKPFARSCLNKKLMLFKLRELNPEFQLLRLFNLQLKNSTYHNSIINQKRSDESTCRTGYTQKEPAKRTTRHASKHVLLSSIPCKIPVLFNSSSPKIFFILYTHSGYKSFVILFSLHKFATYRSFFIYLFLAMRV